MISRGFTTVFAGALMATAISAPAHAETQYFYDAAGRLIKVIYSNGVVIEYRYDAAGNRQQITTAVAPNVAPVARNDTGSTVVSTSVDVAVLNNDTDANGDTLTITGVSTPTGGSAAILSSPARIRYTAPGAAGTYTFTYTISDGHSHAASATVTMTVAAASNQAPVARSDGYGADTFSSSMFFVLGNDTDADGDTLTVTAVGTATGGTASVTPGGGSVTYDAPGSPGTYSFSYNISDGHGGTASSTVSVTVTRPPIEDPGGCPQGEVCMPTVDP